MIAALVALLACAEEAQREEVPTLTEAAERVTLGTVRDLGSCVVRTSLRREVTGSSGPPRVAEETSELRWQDPDHWSWARGRDGRVVEETLVWDAVAWSRTGERPFARRGDAEPHRVQLAGVWDPWSTLESLAEQVALTPGEVETLEGRRVVRHLATLRALPKKAHRTWVAELVEGTVWIDEQTALRLQGDVHVVAAARQERMDVRLAFSVTGIGADPAVVRPPAQEGGETAPDPL